MRYWLDDITPATLKQHLLDVRAYGPANPSKRPFLFQASSSFPFSHWGEPWIGPNPWEGYLTLDYDELDTLVLNWDFETVTGSSALGTFAVPDYSSGSATEETERYGFLGDLMGPQHPGYGYGFPTADTDSIDNDYVLAAELAPFEILNSMDMISVVDADNDVVFMRTSRPLNHQFVIEKSMYRTISDTMLKMFATANDFNNLVGEAANKYRSEYKELKFLRR